MALLLPVAAVVAVYARTARHELVWDDAQLLGSLSLPADGGSFLDVVLAPLVFSASYFRPLGTAGLLLEMRAAGGIAPGVHHAVNVALHAGSTLLVGLLALRVTRGRAVVAAAAAALYGLHPALVEGVAFLASRFDLLVTLFLLAALLADAAITAPRRRAAAVAVLFLLAALSKEMAASFVLVLPLWHLCRAERAPDGRVAPAPVLREHRATYAATLAAGLAYLGLRAAGLSHDLAPAPGIPAGPPLQHALLVAKSLGTYVSLVAWPFGRVAPIHHSVLPVPVSDVFAWVSLALLGAAGAFALVRRSRLGAPALLAFAALLALLPVANLRTLSLGGGAFVAERYLLFPAALAALAVASRIARAPSVAPGLAAAGLWIVAAGIQTAGVVPRWESRTALWTWGMETAPSSAIPPVNLSLAESEAGRPEVGAALARRAIELDSQLADAHTNLGIALFDLRRYAEARDALAAASEIDPGNVLIWNNLGRTLLEMGRTADAERVLRERALPLDPGLPLVHTNLAELYRRVGRPDLEERHLSLALPRLPPAEQARVGARIAELRAGFLPPR